MLAKKIQSKINKKFNSNNIRFAYIQWLINAMSVSPHQDFSLNTVNFN
jgi:hypothetical protein